VDLPRSIREFRILSRLGSVQNSNPFANAKEIGDGRPVVLGSKVEGQGFRIETT